MWEQKNAIGIAVWVVASLAWSILIYYSTLTFVQVTIGYAVCVVLGGIAWLCAAFRLD